MPEQKGERNEGVGDKGGGDQGVGDEGAGDQDQGARDQGMVGEGGRRGRLRQRMIEYLQECVFLPLRFSPSLFRKRKGG